MVGIAFSEVLLMVLMGGMTSLPLGMPPGPEDPVLARVAPESCLFYVSWSGMAAPDPASKNHTEQLLAEKQVQDFVARLDRAITAGLIKDASRGPEQMKVLATEVPKLVKAIISKPTAVFLSKVTIGAGFQPDVEGGIIVNTGDDTANLMKVVLGLEKLAPAELNSVEIGGAKFKELPLGPGAPQLYWGFRGKYMLAGLSQKSIEGILSRGRAEPPKWLTNAREQLKVDRQCSVAYINVKGLMTLIGAAVPFPEFRNALAGLGLGNVDYLASVTGFDDSGVVTRTRVALSGKPTGIFALADGKPLALEDLQPIPRDATIALAARLDLEKVYQIVKTIASGVGPGGAGGFEGEVKNVEEMLGFKLSEDVFQALGDTWRVYNSPSEGGLVFTGLTAVVSVRDKARLENALEKFAAFIQRITEGEKREAEDVGRRRRYVTVKHTEFAGKKIFFVNSVGSPAPFAPAWCLTDKEFVIALQPAGVKEYLSRDKNAASIAALPAVQKLFAGEQKPLAVSYDDTRELCKVGYPVAQMLFTALCAEMQREGVDLDPSMLPTFGALARHIQPGSSSVVVGEQGIDVTSRQSLPISVPMLLPAIMGAGIVPMQGTHEFRAVPAPGFGGAFGGAEDSTVVESFDFDIPAEEAPDAETDIFPRGGDARETLQRACPTPEWLPREWLAIVA